jgi:hypothetical protein
MTSSSNLVAQLNQRWRVVIVSDDAWHDRAAIRTSETLRALVQAQAGRVDADAAAILAALPERVDLRVRGSTALK